MTAFVDLTADDDGTSSDEEFEAELDREDMRSELDFMMHEADEAMAEINDLARIATEEATRIVTEEIYDYEYAEGHMDDIEEQEFEEHSANMMNLIQRVGPQARAVEPLEIKDHVESAPQCVLCANATAHHAVVPCGHLVMCVDCRGELAESITACPVCNGPIQSFFHVFF